MKESGFFGKKEQIKKEREGGPTFLELKRLHSQLNTSTDFEYLARLEQAKRELNKAEDEISTGFLDSVEMERHTATIERVRKVLEEPVRIAIETYPANPKS